MAHFWQAKQTMLYPTSIQISETRSLRQVITEIIQKTATNLEILLQRTELTLNEIADSSITEYILDKLDYQVLKFLVNLMNGILKELKNKFCTSGLDKDVFICL